LWAAVLELAAGDESAAERWLRHHWPAPGGVPAGLAGDLASRNKIMAEVRRLRRLKEQADRRTVTELRKVLHRYRAAGEARLRVLATIAAEGISRPLGRAMKRELKPHGGALAKTRKRLRRSAKAKRVHLNQK
jgi:hypothetical protein